VSVCVLVATIKKRLWLDASLHELLQRQVFKCLPAVNGWHHYVKKSQNGLCRSS